MRPHLPAVDLALLTDLYELTMLQAYLEEGLEEQAVFSLYFRKLPQRRNFLLACGLGEALETVTALRFPGEALEHLEGLGLFRPRFLDWLAGFSFRGEVRAVPEGTPVFPQEPLLEVIAPLPHAQLLETLLMNQLHFQTVIASKAVRVVLAAAGRPVVDFGLRRMHGLGAGLRSTRAFKVAGVAATSNVAGGRLYGLPATGTMAHSYIQAHDDELAAFRAFARVYPETTLLVDTYDTLDGVRKVIALARELGDGFRVRAIRLDSGDLGDLARRSRELLDAAGLERVEIVASGGLDEDAIAALLAAGAPIDGFGVGTRMGVSADAPSVDLAYKLTEYAGRGRLKISPGKPILPGRKQVWRREEDGASHGDLLGLWGEEHAGRPLLRQVMVNGEVTDPTLGDLDLARQRARAEVAALPPLLRGLAVADPPYPVTISGALRRAADEARGRLG